MNKIFSFFLTLTLLLTAFLPASAFDIESLSEDEWIAFVSDFFEQELFDDEFYHTSTDPSALYIINTYEAFKVEAALIEQPSLEAYSTAFDKATLVTITRLRDYATIRNAFVYYTKKSFDTFDMTDINKVMNSDSELDLWKSLKASYYTDYESLIANFLAISGNLAASLPGTSTPSSGGGGFGGGGGGLGGSRCGIYYTKTGNTATFELRNMYDTTADLYIATYKDGQMTEIQKIEVKYGVCISDTTITMDENFDYKVFIWNDTGSLMPLSGSLTLNTSIPDGSGWEIP